MNNEELLAENTSLKVEIDRLKSIEVRFCTILAFLKRNLDTENNRIRDVRDRYCATSEFLKVELDLVSRVPTSAVYPSSPRFTKSADVDYLVICRFTDNAPLKRQRFHAASAPTCSSDSHVIDVFVLHEVCQ